MPDDFRFDIFLSHSSKDKPAVFYLAIIGWLRSAMFVYVIAIASLIVSLPCGAQQPPAVTAAAKRGLEWLLKQQLEDGSVPRIEIASPMDAKEPNIGEKPNVPVEVPKAPHRPIKMFSAPMTGLALLAIHSAGHRPNDATPEGRFIRNALSFYEKHVKPDETGYVGNLDGSLMYGQGIVTLSLATLISDVKDEKQRVWMVQRLEKLVNHICKAQDVKKDEFFQGGWRYKPDSTDSDISVSSWCIFSLSKAREVGLKIGERHFADSMHYVEATWEGVKTPGNVELPPAPFSYSAASGVAALVALGAHRSPLISSARRWMEQEFAKDQSRWFYYRSAHLARAMSLSRGTLSFSFWRDIESKLCQVQNSDGSWSPEKGTEESAGLSYATSLAVMALSLPYQRN